MNKGSIVFTDSDIPTVKLDYAAMAGFLFDIFTELSVASTRSKIIYIKKMGVVIDW